MGSKIAAKALMEKAGVPVLPGATIDDAEQVDAAAVSALADGIGYPLLVKAAFGGGGRGMRIVRSADEVVDAVLRARREAASAFGDGTVFLERFVVDPRHVEVQILGDTHGAVVHLFERECSIQRRYQKIVEEAPSPAVDEALRTPLGDAAVAAGTAIGYTGAGTVEFVLGQDGEFFFLEVNTRLQVEHPVTELVTGLDLVEQQIRVAEGEPLPAEVTGATITGHAIEARLYAEDPTGTTCPGRAPSPVLRARPARRACGHRCAGRLGGRDALRPDAGQGDRARPHPHRGRPEARQGPVRGRDPRPVTNRDLLVAVLREPEFLAGRTDTGYLTRHEPTALVGPRRVHPRRARPRRRAGRAGGPPGGRPGSSSRSRRAGGTSAAPPSTPEYRLATPTST
ncbi:hypothetical protein L7F22_025638 [Adiantum nelumboides]|nr:hypothetical protein [Adiantum nelumboides]